MVEASRRKFSPRESHRPASGPFRTGRCPVNRCHLTSVIYHGRRRLSPPWPGPTPSVAQRATTTAASRRSRWSCATARRASNTRDHSRRRGSHRRPRPGPAGDGRPAGLPRRPVVGARPLREALRVRRRGGPAAAVSPFQCRRGPRAGRRDGLGRHRPPVRLQRGPRPGAGGAPGERGADQRDRPAVGESPDRLWAALRKR